MSNNLVIIRQYLGNDFTVGACGKLCYFAAHMKTNRKISNYENQNYYFYSCSDADCLIC